eukprot:NODE_135_length_18075_cov_0.518413.p1 type:complete len:895 gc:universal NODE_135_length_18075_cov_0.518413:11195-8511(-)
MCSPLIVFFPCFSHVSLASEVTKCMNSIQQFIRTCLVSLTQPMSAGRNSLISLSRVARGSRSSPSIMSHCSPGKYNCFVFCCTYMTRELLLDDFEFTHMTRQMNVSNNNILLSNVLIIQDLRKFTILTMSNKVIQTIPSNQFQKTIYLGNTLFGLTKDALFYYKEEWIKYQVSEILDFCVGCHIYLLTGTELVSVNVEQLPPVSRMLKIPLISHLELLTCHPSLEIAVIYSESTIYVCKSDSFINITYPNLQHIIFHPNGSKVALIQNNTALIYNSVDFINNELNLIQKIDLKPYHRIIWIDSFLADIQSSLEESTLLRIFGNSNYLDIQLPYVLAYYCTLDGLKVVSSSSYHFITPIPRVLTNCLKSSTHPSRLLIDSYSQWSNRIPTLEFLSLPLEPCISHILEASCHTFDVNFSMKLLRIARFGISFLKSNTIQTETSCRVLRILNALRDHYDPFLSYEQYKNNTSLFSWLLAANEHYLALCIAKYCNSNNKLIESILIHYSRAFLVKMKYHPITDEQVAHTILSKCINIKSGYTQMAHDAVTYGRPGTALEFLKFELNPNEQIPLLLKLKQDDKALEQAIKFNSIDLIKLVLLNLINRQVPYSVIYSMISNSFGLHVFKQLKPERWIECCFQLDLKQLHVHGLLRLQCTPVINTNSSARVVDADSILEHKQYLQQAIKLLNDAKMNADVKIVEMELKLLLAQEQLENEVWSSSADNSSKFINLSLNSTITRCITTGLQIKAIKLKNEFKVPDKRYWWIYIKAASTIRDWSSLEKWSYKKSPIGYDPFVKVCLDQGAYKESLKYIPKCSLEHQIKYYMRIKAYNKASHVAHIQRDGNKLKEILERMDREEAGRYLFEADDFNDYAKNQMRVMWMQDVERKLADLGIILINK